MPNQSAQPAQPESSSPPTVAQPVPGAIEFQQTKTRVFGLLGTSQETQLAQPGQPPSYFAQYRERLEAIEKASQRGEKASIYAKDIEAFKLGNEQERARTGGPSR